MKNNYYLLSYDECKEISDTNGNLVFFETKHMVDGFDIRIFNYRLAHSDLFNNPVPNKEYKAHEMRGICFVFNLDGSLYKRYLLLDKFWNLNQTECSMYNNLKDLKIDNVYIKEDGSIASFIKLPNGKVVGKSKASFTSDQAIEITKIYNERNAIKEFVDWTLNNDIVAIFEFVSPENRIVIKYDEKDLILLRMRNNSTGEYIDIEEYRNKFKNIKFVKKLNYTLDELVEMSKTTEGIEGWTIQFQGGKLIKIKNTWYYNLHSLFTEDLNRENSLISLIVNENIDDVISQLSGSSDKIEEVEELTTLIHNYIKVQVGSTNDLLSLYNGDRKDFAIKYIKHDYFYLAIDVINGGDLIESIKNKILKDTSKLQKARDWIKRMKS